MIGERADVEADRHLAGRDLAREEVADGVGRSQLLEAQIRIKREPGWLCDLVTGDGGERHFATHRRPEQDVEISLAVQHQRHWIERRIDTGVRHLRAVRRPGTADEFDHNLTRREGSASEEAVRVSGDVDRRLAEIEGNTSQTRTRQRELGLNIEDRVRVDCASFRCREHDVDIAAAVERPNVDPASRPGVGDIGCHTFHGKGEGDRLACLAGEGFDNRVGIGRGTRRGLGTIVVLEGARVEGELVDAK